jgi:hypothetical protein
MDSLEELFFLTFVTPNWRQRGQAASESHSVGVSSDGGQGTCEHDKESDAMDEPHDG